jgi:exoribonuclease R
VERRDGGYRLVHEEVVAAMGWNAQISLLVGMAAAAAMYKAGVGLLRTLPPPDRDVVRTVRRAARGLGVVWPDGSDYATVVRGLDGSVPAEAALLAIAARGLRGAGYLALAPGLELPTDDDAHRHAAVAAPYAHVTAPLRRLADRPTTEVCLALFAGTDPDPEVVASLPALPKAMAQAAGREGSVARAVIDLVEAVLLAPRVGEVIPATVVSVSPDGSTVVLTDPAVQTLVRGHELPLGEEVTLRIDAADPVARTVDLSPA